MRIHPRAAALAAWLVMIGLAVASVSAAPPPTKAKAKHSPYKVAFLDLTYTYKHHAGFLKHMETFHADVTKAKEQNQGTNRRKSASLSEQTEGTPRKKKKERKKEERERERERGKELRPMTKFNKWKPK